MEWRPIASAPKDGTVVLLFDQKVVMGCRVYVGWMGSKKQWFINCGNGTKTTEPTHWMPLPAPPKES